MDHLLDSLAVAVLREIGKSRPVGAVRKSHLGSSSMTALKLYLQAEQYFRRGAYDSAVPLYQEAVAVDSGFALAWWHLGEANAWLGGRERVTGFRRAAALNHGLSPRDSLLIAADSGWIEYELGARPWSEDAVLFRRALHLLDEAIQRFPDDPEARYKRADLMFHSSYASRVSLREIQQALAQAVALDSGLAEPFEHLVQLTLRLDGPEAGLPLLAAFQRWFPGRARPYDLARRLLSPAEVEAPSTQALMDSMTAGELGVVFYLLGAFPDSQEGAVRALRAIRPSPGDPVPIVRTAEGVQRFLRYGLQNRGHLRQATAAAPYPIDPMMLALTGVLSHDSADALMAGWADSDNGPKRWLRMQWLALAGDSIALQRELPALERWGLKDARERGPEWYRGGRLGQDAYLALARRDTALALKLFHEITDTLCVYCVFERDILVRLHAGRGEVDEAWRLASTRGQWWNPFYFWPFDALALLDHAGLAERLGKRDEAIEDYRYLVGMWRDADPELQKYVTQARNALARLSAEPR
jgi:tetratricopeptide (TPR) repeat protein